MNLIIHLISLFFINSTSFCSLNPRQCCWVDFKKFSQFFLRHPFFNSELLDRIHIDIGGVSEE